MSDVIIPAGHKFAIIALPASLELTEVEPIRLGPNAWAVQKLGVGLPTYWKEWLGTLTLDMIEHATLFLVMTGESLNLDVLDGENAALVAEVGLLYFGLLVATPRLLHERGVQFNGAKKPGESDVRQFGFRPALCNVDGVVSIGVTEADLRRAWSVKDILQGIEGERGFRRVRAALKAYYRGMQEADPAIRIHEFVRCVEAFILPEEGKTRQRFRSRTELFVGPGWHQFMGQAFALRSAEEHLNDRLEVIAAPTEREQILELLRTAHATQSLAQYCLKSTLTNRTLLENFNGDAATKKFWQKSPAERSRQWGQALDMQKVLAEFDPELVEWPNA